MVVRGVLSVLLGLLGPVIFPETTKSHRCLTHSETISEDFLDCGTL